MCHDANAFKSGVVDVQVSSQKTLFCLYSSLTTISTHCPYRSTWTSDALIPAIMDVEVQPKPLVVVLLNGNELLVSPLPLDQKRHQLQSANRLSSRTSSSCKPSREEPKLLDC